VALSVEILEKSSLGTAMKIPALLPSMTDQLHLHSDAEEFRDDGFRQVGGCLGAVNQGPLHDELWPQLPAGAAVWEHDLFITTTKQNLCSIDPEHASPCGVASH
jgi:hypothetical protein